MANIDAIVNNAARKAGVPVNIFRALVKQESGFNPNAKSPAGATGLAQLMPGTARGLGVKNIFDPVENAEAGARYLAQQYEKFGNWRHALAAYNAGPGAVTKYGGIPPYDETQNYVNTIMSSLKGQSLEAGSPSGGQSGAGAGDPSSLGATDPFGGQMFGQVDNSAAVEQRYRVNDILSSLGKLTKSPLSLRLSNIEPTVANMPGGVAATPAATRQTKSAVGGGYGKAPKNARPGTILGASFKWGGGPSDHAKRPYGNWQSDNAYDLLVPVGTPVYAVDSGIIGDRFGSLGKGGKLAGLRLNLLGSNNNYYYAHLSRFAPGIKPGTSVKRGQLLGFSGEAVDVPHLHFGVEHGDPKVYIGGGKPKPSGNKPKPRPKPARPRPRVVPPPRNVRF